MPTEAQILANAFEASRQLTAYYTSLMKEQDPHRIFRVEDKPLNSVYWISAHLAWAEDFLVLRGTGGQRSEVDWLENFSFGSDPEKSKGPEMAEVLSIRKQIHEKAMEHFRSISDAEMDADNALGFTFGGSKAIRNILTHCIRHEASHAGHLGWLCKCYGIKTI